MGVLAVDQSLSSSILLIGGINSTSSSSIAYTILAKTVVLPRAVTSLGVSTVAFIQCLNSLAGSQFAVQAVSLNSTAVSVSYPLWSGVHSLTASLIVSASSICSSCFFDQGVITATSTGVVTFPSQNLS